MQYKHDISLPSFLLFLKTSIQLLSNVFLRNFNDTCIRLLETVPGTDDTGAHLRTALYLIIIYLELFIVTLFRISLAPYDGKFNILAV